MEYGMNRSFAKLAKNVLAFFLAFVMVLGLAQPAFALNVTNLPDPINPIVTEFPEEELTSEAQDALSLLQYERSHHGVLGFEGEFALADDNTPTNVIIMFYDSPAGVQVVEAQAMGYSLSLNQAQMAVESSHSLFRQELSQLFGSGGVVARGLPGGSYNIYAEFRLALNGVAVTLPANMIHDVAALSSVRAIYPDFYVQAPEPVPMDSDRNPFGMSQGRARMGADILHNDGITGEGILVAILDTGIDWEHPAFEGSFITIADMNLRRAANGQPLLTNADGINMGGTYYYVGYDLVRFWPSAAWRGNPAHGTNGNWGNDPMETSPMHHLPPWSSHGTHVAGTIVGRDVALHDGLRSVRGVAYGAQAIHYRVLMGSTPISIIGLGLERVAIDQPDVVNMSLGGGRDNPVDMTTIMVNNLALANPNMSFVVAAGNSGNVFGVFVNATHPGVVANPGNASMAISVSALHEPDFVGKVFNGGGVTSTMSPLTMNASTTWVALPNSRIVDVGPSFRHNDGMVNIFALPDISTGGGATGTQDLGIGRGTDADFAALMEKYTADELRGGFLLVRRATDASGNVSSPFADAVISAFERGFGGVIVVNGVGEGSGALNFFGTFLNVVPGFLIDHQQGVDLIAHLEANDGHSTFYLLSDGTMSPLRVADFSSFGPLSQSFEIKPDIGVHGVNVWSVFPRWRMTPALGLGANNWADVPWGYAYGGNSGTSMAAPHVAGAVALMLQYSIEENGNRWSAEEIRARIMNNAQTLSYSGSRYTPFDGARQIDVVAAISSSTVVYVTYNYVASQQSVDFEQQDFQSMRTGSFSFGPLFRGESATMTATIEGTPGTTYQVSHIRHTASPRPHQNAGQGHNVMTDGVVSYPQSVTVGPGGYVDFDVTVTMPDRNAYRELMVGYIIVQNAGNTVARLPFAAAGMNRVAENIMLYRPVLSRYNSAYRHMHESRTLGILVTAFGGFRYTARFYTVGANGEAEDFVHALPRKHIYRRTITRLGMENWALGTQFRGQLGVPLSDAHLSPGSYILRLVIEAEIGGQERFNPHSVYYVDIPVFIDDVPPEISDIDAVAYSGNDTDVIVTGHVFDEFMEDAIDSGVTFDIWRGDKRQMSLENNLGVWVLIGENTADNRPVRATVGADGSFAAIVPNGRALLPAMITVWAIDNYSPVPQVDRVIGPHVVGSSLPPVVDRIWSSSEYFTPTNYVLTDPALMAGGHLETGRIPGHHSLPAGQQQRENTYVWIGANITSVQVHLDENLVLTPAPVVNISGIPSQIRLDLLQDTQRPINLTHFAQVNPLALGRSDISWTMLSGAATITPQGVLSADSVGVVTVQATIPDGQHGGLAFVQPFTINIVDTNTPVTDVELYRSVLSTGASAAHGPQRDIGIFYQANRGFAIRPHIVRAVDGLTEYNWREPQFAHAYVGYASWRGGNVATTAGNRPFESPLRGMIVGLHFNNFFNPDGTQFIGTHGQQHGYLPEGEYLLILETFEQPANNNVNQSTAWAGDIALTFHVDNTPPTLEWLRVDGQYVNPEGGMDISVHPGDAGVDGRQVLVEGRVSDEWTTWAAQNGITHGAWRAESQYRDVSFAENIAVWVLAGASTAANRPFRAQLSDDGQFSVLLPVVGATAILPTDLNIWIVDGWSIVPIRDGWLGNTINAQGVIGTGGAGDWSHTQQAFYAPTNNLGAPALINSTHFRHARMWGYAANANLNNAMYMGTNITTFNARLVAPPTLSVDIDSVRVTPDGIATVEINLSNNPGINSMRFTVRHDARLHLLSYDADDSLMVMREDVEHGTNTTTFALEYAPVGGEGFAQDTYENGNLVTLTFSAAATVQYVAVAEISIDVDYIFSAAKGSNLTAYNIANGTIQVAPAGANLSGITVFDHDATGGLNNTWSVQLDYGYALSEVTAIDIVVAVVEGVEVIIVPHNLAGGIWHITVGGTLHVLTITIAPPSNDAEITSIHTHGINATRTPATFDWGVITSPEINHERTTAAHFNITLSCDEASYVIVPANMQNTLWTIVVTAQDSVTTTTHTLTITPEARNLVLSDAFVTRPVVRPHTPGASWTTASFPQEASNFILHFTPYNSFTSHISVYRDGVRIGAIQGTDNAPGGSAPGQRHVLNGHGLVLGERHEGMLFQQWGFLNQNWSTYPDGEYELRVRLIYGAGSGITNQWLNIPIFIDHDPPVISDVGVGGASSSLTYANAFALNFSTNATETITVTGNVFDEFMFEAAERGITFDVWNNPQDALVTVEDNLAVWVLVGESAEGNRPVRATVLDNGDFTVDIDVDPATLPATLTIWAVDNWVPHAVGNRVLGNTSTAQPNTGFLAVQDRSNNVRDYFHPEAYMRVADEYRSRINMGLRQEGSSQTSEQASRDYVWSGIHTATAQFTLYSNQLFDIIAVTNIINVPTTAQERIAVDLDAVAEVVPRNATRTDIVWTLVDNNNGQATVTDGVLRSETVGSAIVRATIAGGTISNGVIVDYIQDFTITFTETPPPVLDISLQRTVFSVSQTVAVQQALAATVHIYYTPLRAFRIIPSLYRAADGMTAENWYHAEFEGYFIGSGRRAGAHPNSANTTFNQQTRGQLWNLLEMYDADGERMHVDDVRAKLTTGDYFLVLQLYDFGNGNVYDATDLAQNHFADELIPLSIDNDPPVIEELRINGAHVSTDGGFDIAVRPAASGDSLIRVEGRVADIWTTGAQARNQTSGSIWRTGSTDVYGTPFAANPHQWGGYEINNRNSLAVWVHLMDNNSLARPQRAYVNANGEFYVYLRQEVGNATPTLFPANLTISVFDGWNLSPVRYFWVGNNVNAQGDVLTTAAQWTRASQQFFRILSAGADPHFQHTVRAHGEINNHHHNHARVWGAAANLADINSTYFHGLNMTRFNARLVNIPTITMTPSVLSAEPGDTVEIAVALSGNNAGISEVSFGLRYDTRLMLDTAASSAYGFGLATFTPIEPGLVQISVGNRDTNVTGNGQLFNFVFTVGNPLVTFGDADFGMENLVLWNANQGGPTSDFNLIETSVLLISPGGIVPVENITGIPTIRAIQEMPMDLNALAQVNPTHATNRDIIWEVIGFVPEYNDETTPPTLVDGVITATAAGTINLRATILDATYDDAWQIIDFVQNFEILIIRRPLPLRDLSLVRSMYSFGTPRLYGDTPNVIMYYVPERAARMIVHVVRAEDGMGSRNWRTFEEAFVGTSTRRLGLHPSSGNATFNQLTRGMVLNWNYLRCADGLVIPSDTFTDGKYFIVIEMFEWGNGSATDDANLMEHYVGTVLLPFLADSSTPTIDWLKVNGEYVDVSGDGGFNIAARPATGENDRITIEGRVSDPSTLLAAQLGFTNDAWRVANTPFVGDIDAANPVQWGGYEINLQNNVAVWIHVGANNANNRPQRVIINTDGTFSHELRGANATFVNNFPANFQLRVFNGWSVYPVAYHWIGNNINAQGNFAIGMVTLWSRVSQQYFNTSGGAVARYTVRAHGPIQDSVYQSRIWNQGTGAANINSWFFHGTNLTSFVARLVVPPTLTVFVPSADPIAAGETANVNINIGSNPGLARTVLYMHYDDTLVDFTGITGGLLELYSSPTRPQPGIVRFELYAPSNENVTTASGTLATLTFVALPSTVSATASLNLAVDHIFSAAQGGNISAYNVAQGSIAIAASGPAPVAPSITGGDTALTLIEGYAATHTTNFTITGQPEPTITLDSAYPQIMWNSSYGRIEIATGLIPGVYVVTLIADNGVGNPASHVFTLTVNPAPQPPTPNNIMLSLTPTQNGLVNTGDSVTFELMLDANMYGLYSLTLHVSYDDAQLSVVNIASSGLMGIMTTQDVPGEISIVLTATQFLENIHSLGLLATITFTVLDIAQPGAAAVDLNFIAGTRVGEDYATNAIGHDEVTATGGFITIAPPQTPYTPPVITGGESARDVTVGYAAFSTAAFGFGGHPAPTISFNDNGSTQITWNSTTNRIYVAAGLPSGVYTVTLSAENAYNNGTSVSHVFTLTVNEPVIIPEVIAVTIAPRTDTIDRGTSRQFTATVTTVGDADTAVVWDVSGNDGASISSTGNLVVSAHVREGTVIAVTATSVFDSSVSDRVMLTVTAPHVARPPEPPIELPDRPTVRPPAEPPIVLPVIPPVRPPAEPPVVQPIVRDVELPVQAPEAPQVQLPSFDDAASDNRVIVPASEIFIDVARDSWYHDYISFVVFEGLFTGTTDVLFEPSFVMTRAMFAQMLANFANPDLEAFAETDQIFDDSAPDAWYFAAVQWAVSLGIIMGFGDGNFGPDVGITREQMATMLFNFIQLGDVTLPQIDGVMFTDHDNISPWAIDAVLAMRDAGIISGRPNGSFDPHATATRAEVAAMFARFVKLI